MPEDVNAEEVSPEEWQAEAETVEIVEAAEKKRLKKNHRRRAGSTGAGCRSGRRGGDGGSSGREEQPVEEIAQEQEKPTKEGFFARLKRSLLKMKVNLGSGFISLFVVKKSTMICLRSWKNSC
ncbi:hypothetical protein ACNKHR_14720 [Shigella flexneri]